MLAENIRLGSRSDSHSPPLEGGRGIWAGGIWRWQRIKCSSSMGGDPGRDRREVSGEEMLHVPREGFRPCLSLTDLSCLSILC